MQVALLLIIAILIPLPWGWLTHRVIQGLWRTSPAQFDSVGPVRPDQPAASGMWDYQI